MMGVAISPRNSSISAFQIYKIWNISNNIFGIYPYLGNIPYIWIYYKSDVMTYEKINAKLNLMAKAGIEDHFFMVSRKRRNPKSKPVSGSARTKGSGVHETNSIQLSLF